ncbi:MAG: CcmD family protein [Candidatus Binatia bacterium]
MDHLWFLFGAFSAVWLGIFLYLRLLARRHRELARDVESLRQLLQKESR